jgi:hypothetical protein
LNGHDGHTVLAEVHNRVHYQETREKLPVHLSGPSLPVSVERSARAIASAILFMPSPRVALKLTWTCSANALALSPDRTMRCVIRVRRSAAASNRHSNDSTA